MLLRQPRLLGSRVDRTLRPAVSMLTDLGLSRADIAHRVVQQPHLLACKPERYQDILRVMQERGITAEVTPYVHPSVHGKTVFALTTSRPISTASQWWSKTEFVISCFCCFSHSAIHAQPMSGL